LSGTLTRVARGEVTDHVVPNSHDALNDREQMWRLKIPEAIHISLVQPNVFGLLHAKERFYDANQALVSRIDRHRHAGNARHGSRKLRSQAARR
jgi:hypothetical protein